VRVKSIWGMGSRERSDTSSLRSFNDPAGFLSSASNGLSTACIVKTVSIPGKKKRRGLAGRAPAQPPGARRIGTISWEKHQRRNRQKRPNFGQNNEIESGLLAPVYFFARALIKISFSRRAKRQ